MIVTVVKVQTTRDGYTFASGINEDNSVVEFILPPRLSWVKKEVTSGDVVDITITRGAALSVRKRRMP